MDVIERATILHYHRHRLDAFGEESPRSLGWRDGESQRLRFEVIAAVGAFGGCSVLDVGCGRGDLKAFLDARFDDVTYIGIDHMPEFVHQARRRYAGAARTSFHVRDFSTVELPVVDYVVASGALAYRSAEADFHLHMIEKMFASARTALIVNMLDAAVFPEHPLLVGRDASEVEAFCRRLSDRVEVVRGYQDDDFTVCVSRPRRSPSS